MRRRGCASLAPWPPRTSSSLAKAPVPQAGLAALRLGGPQRRAYIRGSLPDLTSGQQQEQALRDLERGFYADSSRASYESRSKTIAKIFAQWGVAQYPPSVHTVRVLGASLKAGGYRSAAAYFSMYAITAEREGWELSQAVRRAITDATRSCERGIGGPVRARALPLAEFHRLPGGRDPWVPSGPLSPRNVLVVGSFWMMREIEVSSARAQHVELLDLESSAPVARMILPVSKTDQRAEGLARGYRCQCGGDPAPACPVHALWDQLLFLRRQFGHAWASHIPPGDFPLFPDLHGQPCMKSAMVRTIEVAAGHLGVPLELPDGSERISGHSLRASGAQGLDALGHDLWAIQLMGRWGSDAVQAYVRESHVRCFERASPHFGQLNIDDLVSLISERVSRGLLEQGRAGEGAVRRELGTLAPGSPIEVAEVVTDVVTTRLNHPQSLSLCTVVINPTSGIAHALEQGRIGLTRCGWRVGHLPDSAYGDEDTLPKFFKMLCACCWPSERLKRKERFVRSATSSLEPAQQRQRSRSPKAAHALK